LDRRLYLPQEWVEDEAFAERRRRCGVPKGMTCQTKPTLGGEMLAAVHHSGSLRVQGVTCDEAFGRDTRLLDHLDGLGLWYFAEVPHDTHVWRPRPATAVPAWSDPGRKPTCTRVLAGEAQPEAVAPLAAWLPPHRWVRRTSQEGSKRPLVARVVALRVIDEVRSWRGWQPHMTLCLLAHGFLVRARLR
jgi:SRSO17 transposase